MPHVPHEPAPRPPPPARGGAAARGGQDAAGLERARRSRGRSALAADAERDARDRRRPGSSGAQATRRQAIAALLPSLTLHRQLHPPRARGDARVIDGDDVTVQAVDASLGQAVVESVALRPARAAAPARREPVARGADCRVRGAPARARLRRRRRLRRRPLRRAAARRRAAAGRGGAADGGRLAAAARGGPRQPQRPDPHRARAGHRPARRDPGREPGRDDAAGARLPDRRAGRRAARRAVGRDRSCRHAARTLVERALAASRDARGGSPSAPPGGPARGARAAARLRADARPARHLPLDQRGRPLGARGGLERRAQPDLGVCRRRRPLRASPRSATPRRARRSWSSTRDGAGRGSRSSARSPTSTTAGGSARPGRGAATTSRARTPRRCASASPTVSPPRSSRPTPWSRSSRPRPSSRAVGFACALARLDARARCSGGWPARHPRTRPRRRP